MSDFVKHLWTLVNGLPESIPEGSKFDKLAYFVCNPKDFDDPTVDADELWEMGLNNALKSVFGWGSEQNMDDIIWCGKWGLDGLVKFVTYFIEERGMCYDFKQFRQSSTVVGSKVREMSLEECKS